MSDSTHSHQVHDAVLRASSPQQALAVVADGIDQVMQRLTRLEEEYFSQPVGAVDSWGGPWAEPAVTVIEPTDYAPYLEEILAVKAALAAATGEDRQALEAQLNLLREAAGENVYGYASGNREATPDGNRVQAEGDDVVIPPASKERRSARALWAIESKLHEFLPLLGEDEAVRAFAKGGPMWLYEGNRDAIMQMPYEARVWLVKDVALDSEAQAQELGRDILKSPTSTDQQITTAAILDGAVAGRG